MPLVKILSAFRPFGQGPANRSRFSPVLLPFQTTVLRHPFGALLAVVALVLCQAAPAQTDLVPLGSVWKYLDDGSDQGTAWVNLTFDDSSWAAGPAQLGYGDGDEATVVGYGGDTAAKHITTYFRHTFEVSDPAQWSALECRVQRDDGVVVYLNGQEIFRDNLPTGSISATTFASTAVGGASESELLSTPVDPALLANGTNLLAVEMHQANLTSSDISFNLVLSSPSPVVRGPYLQKASAGKMTVCWRTPLATDAVVRYGTDAANLDQTATSPELGTDHAVTIAGLAADTRYYYSIGDSGTTLAAGDDYYFETHPASGAATPTRLWILGDSGTADANAAAVRDAFVTHNGGDPHADLLLMLGDNAYNSGTDSEYQAAVFEMYPATLRNTVLWSCLGNHDGYTADSASQSGPYYDIHHFPTAAESGGLASGTEAYYSFDYANIHFVCLDSYETDRGPGKPMANWLQDDLAATTQDWIIAFWHHPPYSKGSHDSDTEGNLIDMRENFLPILENFGVDLVLGGHSHSYERSSLIAGHYGSSATFDAASMVVDGGDGDPVGDGAYSKIPAMPQGGAIYAVAGSSGKKTSAPLDHPVMIRNFVELGSMVLDVNGNQLDALFLNSAGTIRDQFTIIHDDTPLEKPLAPDNLSAVPAGPDQIDLAWNDNADNESEYLVERSLDGTAWTLAATLGANVTSYRDLDLSPDTTYLYRVLASNSAGPSVSSNTASATTESLPPYLDSVAVGETPSQGTIMGSYLLTHSDDDSVQAITEIESGGKPSRRHSLLEHVWSFDLPAGLSSTLFANAYSGGSGDGDEFLFTYSTDAGATWSDAFVISSNDSGNEVTGLLGSANRGNLLVKVTDTDRSSGNRSLDTVYIDELFVRTETIEGDPPLAPSDLSATVVSSRQINLAWTNQATDALGLEIERLTGEGTNWEALATVGPEVNSYSDDTASPLTGYRYRVRAYNASGASAFSNLASATTPDGITLTASGDKVKGVIHVTLEWTNLTTAEVDIHRNGEFYQTVANRGNYTDDTGTKGGGTFTYLVCEKGNPEVCSNEVTVSF